MIEPPLVDANELATRVLELKGKPTLALVAAQLGIGTVRIGRPEEEARVLAQVTTRLLVLAEQGYARTTTNGIAARAGVNVALLYRYFAGKEAIVGALIERHADTTYAAVQSALNGQPAATLPSAVRALLEALVGTPGVPALHRELVEQIDDLQG